MTVSIPTTPVPGLRPLMAPGEEWTEPTIQREALGSGYGLLFDVRRTPAPPAFSFTFTCKDPWAGPIKDKAAGRYTSDGAYKVGPDSWPDNPAIGTRHFVALSDGYELITAASIARRKRFRRPVCAIRTMAPAPARNPPPSGCQERLRRGS